MRIDWLPFSASALVAGATTLALAAFLMPTGDSIQIGKDQALLAVAGLYFAAAVALTLGIPAVLTLLDQRTARLGLTAVSVFAVGCLGTAGYATLLVFFRALVQDKLLQEESLDQVTSDAGLGAFLLCWIGAFYLGELLIAIALLRARTIKPWIPALLIAHALLFPVVRVLPDRAGSLAVVLVTVGFAGIGIAANTRHVVTTAAA